MIAGYLPLALIVPAVIMAAEDFCRREVGVLWLALFIIGAAGLAVWTQGWQAAAINAVMNLSLVLYMAGGVLLYLRIRNKRWINPLRRHFGTGDLLFILGMAPLFGLKEYLLFLLISMVAALLWWLATGRRHTIPLVGVMGIVLSIFLIYKV